MKNVTKVQQINIVMIITTTIGKKTKQNKTEKKTEKKINNKAT